VSGARDVRHAPEALALKVATKSLVRAAGGGEGAAATCGVRVRQQRMSDCGNPNTLDFLRIDEVACLEDVTVGVPGWPLVTRALARRQGFELVRLPEALPENADLLKLLAESARESGDIASALLAALADGSVSRKEAGNCIVQVDEQLAVLVQMRAALSQIEQEGGQ
jgi:hypothetical protein